MIKAFDKRRQDTCEELTHQTLAAVFGPDHVHAGVSYPADGQRPDIDVLVSKPGASLVVEAKGGRFTDPARRAAPERVRKKTGELVDKALAQNARTIAYLESGGADLRDRYRRRLSIPNTPHIVSIIVTLDRVDPFATHLPDAGKRVTEPEAGTWLVTLADLLMVADILPHSTEFYAYAQTRASINKIGGPRIFVEADALGVWCEHRLRPIAPRPGELALLDTTSEIVNAYYTHVDRDAGNLPPRPTTGIPPAVLNVLDEALHSRPEHWHDLATAAFAVRPSDWRVVRRALMQNPAGQAADATTRRDRKRAHLAAAGIKLESGLTTLHMEKTRRSGSWMQWRSFSVRDAEYEMV